ncbi:MAG: hypothetical protein IPP46_14615 [Bacteroidetes bacterium]|nr:hypothetical protein [Bacteroidota bacterium]
MKKLLFVIMLFLLSSYASNSAVSRVFVALSNETLSTVPIQGNLTWSTYLGSSKLAFAKGYTYVVKIEFSSGSLGTFKSSSTQATISGLVKSGTTYQFNLAISPTATRLATFNIGLESLNPLLTANLIPCEIVEIGKFYSLILRDTSNTTRSLATKSPGMSTIVFKNLTGKKSMKFSGSSLTNVKFSSSGNSYISSGITVNPASLTDINSTNFSIEFSATSINSTSGAIKDVLLSRVFDVAADKAYPWVSYKYALMIPPSGQTPPPVTNTGGSGPLTSSTVNFEILPGKWQVLDQYSVGYNIFLDGRYMVD